MASTPIPASLCAGFGKNGVIDVNAWLTINSKWKIGLIQPPAVYKDTLILGWAGNDWVYKTENPGTVYGIDARTGALKWTFNIIPPDMLNQTGTANVWAGISVDPETGLAFLPVSSPSPNYYGGDRLKEMPYATATVAVNAETGEVKWARQLVHHDIWDVDINSAPTLVDIKKDGQTIPALVQATKMGFLFVLNRNTGEPVYPIEERPYPASDVQGEVAAKTQPYVPLPEPTIGDHDAAGFDTGRPGQLRGMQPLEGAHPRRRPLHATVLARFDLLAGDGGRCGMGRRRGGSHHQHLCGEQRCGAADLHLGAACRGRQEIWQCLARQGRLCRAARLALTASGWRTS